MSVPKINPEIDDVFYGFWKLKCSQNPSQNHKKSIPKAIQKPNTKKQQKTCKNKPSQTLQIELSCRRRAIFHYFTGFKNIIKSSQKTSQKGYQNHLKIYKKVIYKISKKTTLKYHLLSPKMTPKWSPGATMSMLPRSGFGTPGPPKAPNTSKDHPGTPKYTKK